VVAVSVTTKLIRVRLPRLLLRGVLKGLTAISLFCTPAIGQNAQNPQNAQSPRDAENAGAPAGKPDNSRRNAVDQPTAEDQGNSPQDRELTRNIRRGLVNNDSLSSTAKNIKVITENGKVILRGPVASEEERRTIATLAEQIAGKGNVTNQLEPKER